MQPYSKNDNTNEFVLSPRFRNFYHSMLMLYNGFCLADIHDLIITELCNENKDYILQNEFKTECPYFETLLTKLGFRIPFVKLLDLLYNVDIRVSLSIDKNVDWNIYSLYDGDSCTNYHRVLPSFFKVYSGIREFNNKQDTELDVLRTIEKFGRPYASFENRVTVMEFFLIISKLFDDFVFKFHDMKDSSKILSFWGSNLCVGSYRGDYYKQAMAFTRTMVDTFYERAFSCEYYTNKLFQEVRQRTVSGKFKQAPLFENADILMNVTLNDFVMSGLFDEFVDNPELLLEKKLLPTKFSTMRKDRFFDLSGRFLNNKKKMTHVLEQLLFMKFENEYFRRSVFEEPQFRKFIEALFKIDQTEKQAGFKKFEQIRNWNLFTISTFLSI